MNGESPGTARRPGLVVGSATVVALGVAAWLVPAVRAAIVLAVLLLPAGFACLGALSRDHSRGLAGLSRAVALGLAVGALIPLAVNQVGLGHASLWVTVCVVDAAAVGVLLRNQRRQGRTWRTLQAAWPAWPASRRLLLPVLAVASVAGAVLLAVQVLPARDRQPPPSTQFFFQDGGSVTNALWSAAPSSVVPIAVALSRAPGDTRDYELRLSVAGSPTRVVTTLSPSGPSTVTVPLNVPTTGCAFRVSMQLFAAGSQTPSYELTGYGSGGVGKSCADSSRPPSATTTTTPAVTPRR
jgi:hypothetical protein